jgi:membrane protease YdiL (CAAX protease family)
VPDVLKIVITPVALMLGALIGTWRNGLDPRRDLGLQRPTLRDAVIWSFVFVLLVASFEMVYHLAGTAGSKNDDWRKYAPGALALRILSVALIYPVAEEFFFRGFLLGLITRRAGALAGIVVTALLFAALHGLQSPFSLGALQVFSDGLFFAFVRLRTGSLLLPAAFHILGNSLAIVQRL